MGPLIGALLGGGASGIFGGAGGGGLMGGLMGKLLGGSGGLGGLLSNLFGGGQQAGAGGANDQTTQLLGEIKDMLGKLLDQNGGGQAGGAGGPGGPGGAGGPGGGHGCGGSSEPSCGGASEPSCHGASEPSCGGDQHGCDDVDDDAGHCDSKPTHDCGDADEPEWDGEDKSPSLDRERGAARLLDQAKNTDDPEQKRELIDMALDMLGDGPKKGGMFGQIMDKRDGNSYDKDIVDQAKNMLDQIDKGNLSCGNESKALDSVIDMLKGEGGVDGKPASNDADGDGRSGIGDHPMPLHHHGLHDALFHSH